MERSSTKLSRLHRQARLGATLGLSAVACGCAHAPDATARLSATDMPELGETLPAAASDATVRPRLVAVRMTLDTPVVRLCADPRAKAVLDTDLPGLTTRPEYPFFKNMSLNRLKKMSRGKMSDADLAKVGAELARIEDEPPPLDTTR